MLLPVIFSFLGGIGLGEILFLLLVGLIPLGLFIYAILDLIKRDFNDSTVKLIWALVIVFMPVIGSIIYLVAGRK